MNMVIRSLLTTVLLGLFYAVLSVSLFGQNTLEDCTTIYQALLDNRTSTDVKKLRLALSSANDYMKKCGDREGQGDEIKTFVTKEIPKIEERIKAAEIKMVEDRYASAVKTRNYDEMLATARELLKMDRPYALDLMLDVARVGYDNASAKPAVNKYNDDAIASAKQALKSMGEGKGSGNIDTTTGAATYGYYVRYKTVKCPDGQANAAGFMNYIVGYITYVSLKQSKDALPYLYKASETGCATKGRADIYSMIGDWYVDEAVKIDTTRIEKVKLAGGKDTDETLALLAMQKGYIERASDSYSRAFKSAKASETASQGYRDALLQKSRELYGFRLDGDVSKFESYIEKAGTTPFVDPATPITPIKEEVAQTTPPKAMTNPSTTSKPKAKVATKTKAVKAPSRK